MNHKVTMLVVAIVAAMTLTAVAFAIPQQALAYRHHHNNSHNNSITHKANKHIRKAEHTRLPGLHNGRAIKYEIK